MRIGDWSSDVCASDLVHRSRQQLRARHRRRHRCLRCHLRSGARRGRRPPNRSTCPRRTRLCRPLGTTSLLRRSVAMTYERDREVLTHTSVHLSARFEGVFAPETIERLLHESYDTIAATPKVPTYLPLLPERFAHDPPRTPPRTNGPHP